MNVRISNSAQNVLIGSFLLMLVAIVAVYIGNLTATLTVYRITWPFTTVKEFASSNYDLYVWKGTVHELVLQVQLTI